MNSKVKDDQKIPSLSISSNFNFINNPLDSPREIGCYSVDGNKKLRLDRSQMKYFVPRSLSGLPIDLKSGYENTIRREFNYSLPAKVEPLLKWIYHYDLDVIDKQCNQNVDFITLRGTLQKILSTPYCTGLEDEWIICATKWKGRIYFCLASTEYKIHSEQNASERFKQLSSWGYKFEQFMTADRPWGIADTSSITHEIEEFDIVLNNRLKNHNLIYKAEIDGADPDSSSEPGSGDPSCYVELKTTRLSPKFRSNSNVYKYKTLQWWAQAYLAGTKTIICGMRDDDGIVKFIENYKTSELPLKSHGAFIPNVCFNFCDSFLTHLKNIVVEDDYRVVYKFHYDRGNEVTCEKLRDPDERFQLIPTWYASGNNNS